MQNSQVEVTDEYDREFINLIMEIEKRSDKILKHDKLRVNSWCKKLCQVTNNIEWKKNRNLHAICLLDMVLNERFEEPYNKFAPEGSVPIISKTIVKSRLSTKFLKNTMQMQSQNQQQQNNYYEEKENNIQQQQMQNIAKQVQQPHPKSFQKFVAQQQQQGMIIDNSAANDSVNNEENAKLKDFIRQLQNELKKKDEAILKYKEDKMKADKKIQELEKMLSSFMVSILLIFSIIIGIKAGQKQ